MLLQLLDVEVEEPGVQDVLGAIGVRKVVFTHGAWNAGRSTVFRRGEERLGCLARG
jgi:hypothetical protein